MSSADTFNVRYSLNHLPTDLTRWAPWTRSGVVNSALMRRLTTCLEVEAALLVKRTMEALEP